MHLDYSVGEDCMNINSYGEICVKCNCCGRFDESTKIEAQRIYWNRLLVKEQEELEKITSKIYKNNVKNDIKYFNKKLKELEGLK